jgi:hypothetical protein
MSLAVAAAELPRRRRGRKTHVATLYRWAKTGCRGVVLETIQIGATKCTSREALERFFEKLTLLARGATNNDVQTESPASDIQWRNDRGVLPPSNESQLQYKPD